MIHGFVPDDYVVPLSLIGPGFRLEPLGPRHNDADHRAWMSSIEHIQATPGFSTWRWPPADGMSLEENLRDLQRHADDFKQRVGFTYTVLDDHDIVVGCVYIYPLRSRPRRHRSTVLGHSKPGRPGPRFAQDRGELARYLLAVGRRQIPQRDLGNPHDRFLALRERPARRLQRRLCASQALGSCQFMGWPALHLD